MLIGGIEAGGTKFVCAVGTGPDDIRAEKRFPTTTPEETIGQTITFFKEIEAQKGALSAIGIASFGPIDLDHNSPTYGSITTTPKPGWGHTDFVGRLASAFQIPIGLDTDVNGAALAEGRWGAAQELHTFIYLTIGTGIGGGAMVNGSLLHGLTHPEMGHIPLHHDIAHDPYPGFCPYHQDCLEGLAAGPAIEARWGKPGAELGKDHPAWDLEASYLAQALQSFTVTLSPQRIILGGGVMEQEGLIEKVRLKTADNLNGYIQHPQITKSIDSFIVNPALGNKAGLLGAIALGRAAIQ